MPYFLIPKKYTADISTFDLKSISTYVGTRLITTQIPKISGPRDLATTIAVTKLLKNKRMSLEKTERALLARLIINS